MVLCAHIRAVDLLWCERPVLYSTYVRVSTNALAGRKKEKKKVAPKGARSARLSGVGAPPERHFRAADFGVRGERHGGA